MCVYVNGLCHGLIERVCVPKLCLMNKIGLNQMCVHVVLSKDTTSY